MYSLVSIDPGLRQCGVAIWEDKKLVKAQLVRSPYDGKNQFEAAWHMASAVDNMVMIELFQRRAYLAPTPGVVGPDELVIERPQVIRGWTRNAGSITALTLVVGALLRSGATELTCKLTEYLPVQQKGNVPKDIMEQRTRKRLSAAELAAVELPMHKGKISASLAHNVWDAVWLGLQHAGRK